jgi:hypothetical protein
MSENNRIFDEFPKVDCNECSRYWDNSCDGVLKGSEKPCNSFLATRSVILPEEIKSLKTALKAHRRIIGFTLVTQLLMLALILWIMK